MIGDISGLARDRLGMTGRYRTSDENKVGARIHRTCPGNEEEYNVICISHTVVNYA